MSRILILIKLWHSNPINHIHRLMSMRHWQRLYRIRISSSEVFATNLHHWGVLCQYMLIALRPWLCKRYNRLVHTHLRNALRRLLEDRLRITSAMGRHVSWFLRGNVLETWFCLLSVVCDDVEIRFEVCSEIWIVKKWQRGLVVVDHINLRIVQREDSLATLDLF